jgi:CTP:molybdopterin cytidylyltransferase MocA
MARPFNPAILLLAAGASRRMGAGRDKLMEDVDGAPLLARSAQTALKTGAKVMVALPPDRSDRLAALPQGVHPVIVKDAHMGMGRSIAAGAQMAQGAGYDALMILPADMPDITAEDLSALLGQYETLPARSILRATDQTGLAGHPVIFPPADFAALSALQGDMGARAILQTAGARVLYHPLPGTHATTDLDTPQAWQDWRASRGR